MCAFLMLVWPLVPALILGLLAGLLLHRAAAAPEDFEPEAGEQQIATQLTSATDTNLTPGWERRASGPSAL